mmetsp:Transcript_80344/g.260285  ORF Transcript_80344/g.260285 Transcript_80344/m.260285 type:complete len:212 (-) Transcript_80344:636-1271(-)
MLSLAAANCCCRVSMSERRALRRSVFEVNSCFASECRPMEVSSRLLDVPCMPWRSRTSPLVRSRPPSSWSTRTTRPSACCRMLCMTEDWPVRSSSICLTFSLIMASRSRRYWPTFRRFEGSFLTGWFAASSRLKSPFSMGTTRTLRFRNSLPSLSRLACSPVCSAASFSWSPRSSLASALVAESSSPCLAARLAVFFCSPLSSRTCRLTSA